MAELLTAQEVAERMKVHINTIYNWINSGDLKASKAGDLWRVYETDLDAFLKSGVNTGKGV